MTPTPERALELAEWAKDTASYFDTTDEHGYIVTEAEEEKAIYLQLSELARHYAEILPKWQAVLDAEVVARRITAPDGHASLHKGSAVSDRCFTQIGYEVTQLIIKPAP